MLAGLGLFGAVGGEPLLGGDGVLVGVDRRAAGGKLSAGALGGVTGHRGVGEPAGAGLVGLVELLDLAVEDIGDRGVVGRLLS